MNLGKLFGLPGKNNPPGHELIARDHLFSRELNRDLPLHDYEMVVLDTELTGMKAGTDEIVAMGAVRISNMQILCGQTFYALVKPEKTTHTQSTFIHRLTPDELTKARPLSEVLPEFLEFCRDSVHIGHYVRLDLEFINLAARSMLGGVLKAPYLDTMRMAMAFNEAKHGHYYDHYNIRDAYTLPALSREFDLPVFDEHNALQDALQTAYLFLFLVKKMRDYGCRTLNDYLKAGRKWKIIL